jgi:hypothetical protein
MGRALAECLQPMSFRHGKRFDYASFPMHNQVSYSFLNRDAVLDACTTSYMPESIDPDYGLDKTLRL